MTNTGLWSRFTGYVSGTTAPMSPAALAAPPARTTPNTTLILDTQHEYLRVSADVQVMYTMPSTAIARDQVFQIARAAIQRRAEEVSRRYTVTQPDRIHAELCSELRDPTPIGVDDARAWAACAGVRARSEDREVVERFEQAQIRISERARQDESSEYLRRRIEPLLTDPRRATAWWLANNPTRIADLLAMAQIFTQLHDIFTAGPVPDPATPETLGDLVDELSASIDTPGAHLLGWQLRRLFAMNDRHDLAERAARLSGVSDPLGPIDSPEIDDPDTDLPGSGEPDGE
ncbi:MAG TPA: hypothetical protein VGN37_22865 [Actinocatenispora sp.]